MRIKEFLSVRGIEYRSVNILDDANGMDELRKLGARSIPVVAKGGQFVFAQSLGDVVKFLGLNENTGPALSPDELVSRMELILSSAARFARQMPDALLEKELPNRPRSYRVLMHHIFQIPQAFLDALKPGGVLTYENLVAPPPDDMRSSEAIAVFGEGVVADVKAWWDGLSDKSAQQPVDTYFGVHPLHEVLERTTWHSGQHVRQLMSLLEQNGIAVDRPLSMKDYEGLPVPSTVWDE